VPLWGIATPSAGNDREKSLCVTNYMNQYKNLTTNVCLIIMNESPSSPSLNRPSARVLVPGHSLKVKVFF
jgi:hypothetical protein